MTSTPAPRRRSVLVTNDDGIYAPGLRALVAAIARTGVDVFVCSPSGGEREQGGGGGCAGGGMRERPRSDAVPHLPFSERSALSHAITMRKVREGNDRDNWLAQRLGFAQSN